VGWSLNDLNECQLSNSASVLAGCASFNGSICIKCSKGYFFDSKNNCIKIDDNCRSFNSDNRVCESCYDGYALDINNNCQISDLSNHNLNCKTYINHNCTECSFGYYFDKNGTCIRVSSQCKSYDTVNGQCLTCYIGYSLSNGTCNLDNSSNLVTNCKKAINGTCAECSYRYYLNNQS
jgi:hypothetical protein